MGTGKVFMPAKSNWTSKLSLRSIRERRRLLNQMQERKETLEPSNDSFLTDVTSLSFHVYRSDKLKNGKLWQENQKISHQVANSEPMSFRELIKPQGLGGFFIYSDCLPYLCVYISIQIYCKQAQHLKLCLKVTVNRLLTLMILSLWTVRTAVTVKDFLLGSYSFSIFRAFFRKRPKNVSYLNFIISYWRSFFQAKKKRKILEDNLLLYWRQWSAIHSYPPRKMAKKKVFLVNYIKIYFWKLQRYFTKFFSAQAPNYNPDLPKYKLVKH